MLEHSAMYLNVTPPYEEDTSFFPDFYTTRWVSDSDVYVPVSWCVVFREFVVSLVSHWNLASSP